MITSRFRGRVRPRVSARVGVGVGVGVRVRGRGRGRVRVIDHLRGDSLLCEGLGCLERGVHAARVGDDGHVCVGLGSGLGGWRLG